MAYYYVKRDKRTEIYFNEYDKKATIITANTNLKKRLLTYAQNYPSLCKCIGNDEYSVEYEIQKDRLSIRLLPPCSENRKNMARKLIEKINKVGDGMWVTQNQMKCLFTKIWMMIFNLTMYVNVANEVANKVSEL